MNFHSFIPRYHYIHVPRSLSGKTSNPSDSYLKWKLFSIEFVLSKLDYLIWIWFACTLASVCLSMSLLLILWRTYEIFCINHLPYIRCTVPTASYVRSPFKHSSNLLILLMFLSVSLFGNKLIANGKSAWIGWNNTQYVARKFSNHHRVLPFRKQ